MLSYIHKHENEVYYQISIHRFKGGISIYQTIQSRKSFLETEIPKVQQQISQLPPGSIYCLHDRNYVKWYHSHNGNHYIPKKELAFAEQLAYKKYLSSYLSDLQNELLAVNSYLHHFDPARLKTDKLLTDPSFHKLLANYLKPISSDTESWKQAPYEKNPYFPEQCIFTSISGNKLRSKSEAIIDMLLFQSDIPYRYECKLLLNDIILYPDFTLLHPTNGNIIYWEHFGMLDNKSYANKYSQKMNLYINNGIYPSINLICTYETKDHPLSPATVQKEITRYFS